MDTSTLEPSERVATGAPPRRRARTAGPAVGAAVVGLVDGFLGVALPFAVLAALAMLAWAGLGAPAGWSAFVRGAADAWLIGHGVDVRFAVAGHPFTVTVAALGPALVTAAAAVRAGRRAVRTPLPVAALGGLVVATALAAAGVLLAGTGPDVAPSAWQAVLVPTALVAVVAAIAGRSARGAGERLPAEVRAGLAAVAALIGAAALALALQLAAHLPEVVGLAETLSAGTTGGLALTALQVLALPTVVVWAASWLLGAEVTLGAGSATGPFGAQLGPLPALPVLGAVPADPPPAAAAVLLVPVLIGFGAAVLARRRGARTGAVRFGAGVSLVAGASLGLLAAVCAGSAGPGRFGTVGPDGLLVAGTAALLIGLPAMLGAAVVRPATAAGRPTEAEETAQ